MRLLLIFLLYPIVLMSQETIEFSTERDSIIFYLENAYGEKAYRFSKRAFELSKESENDTLIKQALIKFGLEAYRKKDIDGLNKSRLELLNQYNRVRDSSLLAKHLHYRALFHRLNYQKDSTYYYYHQSKNISLLLNDSLEVGRRLLSMGYMQNNEADYVGAQNTLTEALRYLEPTKKIRFIGDSYNALGNALSDLGNYSESRIYYKKARQIFEKSENEKLRTRWELIALNNIGNSFLLESNPKKAIESLKEALSITDSIQYNYPNQYRSILGNLADCQYLLGEKDKAMQNLNELMRIREEDGDKYGLSLSYNGFAYYFELEGKKQKAIDYALKGYELSKKVNNTNTLLSTLLKLGRLTSGKQSKDYYNEYVLVRDSLKAKERYLKNQYARIRFETEKIDKENAGLKLENTEQAAQIKSEEQQKIIGWLFSLAAVLALGFSFYIFKARRKKLMYEAQLQKASAREEERQQIAKSLHDEVAGDLRMLHQKLSKTELQGEAKSVEKIKDNVRNLSHQLSSVSFDEVSFKDQLINLISDNFSLDFKISAEGIDAVSWGEVNNTIKRTLYLCIRESLQNTLKYAEANKFFIQFSSEKKEILLLLKDNGKGFEKGKGKKGIGLKNLKERVEEIHGTFQINSSEEGTQTNISIPINGR